MNLCSKDKCTGCMACINICPHNAINSTFDEDGFRQPSIDDNLCVECGLCVVACPVLGEYSLTNSNNPSAYASWHKSVDIRRCSTSGGAFSALAESVLISGGLVCGVALQADMTAKHILIDKVEDLSKLRGSKYIQSEIGDIYSLIKSELKAGHKVLFSGTPCQIAGLYSFLRTDYQNLYTVEVVCHGVGSQLAFERFSSGLEQKIGKLKSVNFRDKINGWQISTISYFGKDKITRYASKDIYMKSFYSGLCHRLSCYNCRFSKLPRVADVTLADYWGIDSKVFDTDEYKKGISLLLVNNKRGQELVFSELVDIYLLERPLSEAINGNKHLVSPNGYNDSREFFFNMLREGASDKKIMDVLFPKNLSSRIADFIGPKNSLRVKLIKNRLFKIK